MFSLPSRKFLSRQTVYSPVWRFFLTVEKVPAKLTRFTWYNLYISSFHSEWTRFQPMIQLRVPCPWQPARLNTHRYVLPSCLNFSTFTFGRVMKIARTEKAFWTNGLKSLSRGRFRSTTGWVVHSKTQIFKRKVLRDTCLRLNEEIIRLCSLLFLHFRATEAPQASKMSVFYSTFVS